MSKYAPISALPADAAADARRRFYAGLGRDADTPSIDEIRAALAARDLPRLAALVKARSYWLGDEVALLSECRAVLGREQEE